MSTTALRAWTGLLSAGLLSMGCGGPQRTGEPDTVQMKEHVRETEAPPVDPVEPAPPPTPPAEELAVEIINLRPGEPVQSQSGTTIELTAPDPPHEVVFSRGSARSVVTYPREPLYAEGIAFGELYTISKFGDDVQVTLRSDAPPKPLPAEDALEIARRQRANQLGCGDGEASSVVEDNGTVTLTVRDGGGGITCQITVGRYTRRVVDL